jgi:twitching motility protein PilI
MAKKFNLREFQTNLSRQIQAASTRLSAASHLGFRVGDGNWLVPLNDTEEVIPVPLIVSVPGTQLWFRGMANIRGNLFAVSDMANFLGGRPTPNSSGTRLLIPHHQFGVNVALLVEGTLGLKNVSQYHNVADAPGKPWAARKYLDEAGTGWTVLDFAMLLNDIEFMKVEAH